MEDFVVRYWPLIAFLLTIVIIPALWAWIRSGLVTRKEYDDQMAAEQKQRIDGQADLDRRFTLALAGVDRRLLQVETDIKHLPTAEDMGELKDQLSNLTAQGVYMTKELNSVSGALTRVEAHLMKRPSTA